MNQKNSRVAKSPVLVVSNDLSTAKLIRACLTLEGIQVDVSHNGTEAMEKVSEKEYGLVLTDVVIPGIGGNDLCREIKKRDIGLPVMAIAAEPSRAVAPFERVQKKPFRVKELAHVVHEVRV